MTDFIISCIELDVQIVSLLGYNLKHSEITRLDKKITDFSGKSGISQGTVLVALIFISINDVIHDYHNEEYQCVLMTLYFI